MAFPRPGLVRNHEQAHEEIDVHLIPGTQVAVMVKSRATTTMQAVLLCKHASKLFDLLDRDLTIGHI
jgi:hypothetical protein